MAVAVIPAEQEKAPVELVMVQPVDPDPPPMRMSPVPVLLRFRAPVPLASMERATLASPPVAAKVTPLPVAALAIVISLTAEATGVNLKNSLSLVSKISAPVSFKSPEREVTPAVKARVPSVSLSIFSPKAKVISPPTPVLNVSPVVP